MSGGDWKAMFKAVQIGDINLVNYYLKTGIDINYQHPEYLASALVESIRFDHFEITKLLLENGADPLIVEMDEGDTPMSVANSKSNSKVLSLLESYIAKQ